MPYHDSPETLKDYLAEKESKLQAEMKGNEERTRRERRIHVVRRRWVAMRSAVAEWKEKTAASVRIQSRARAYQTEQERRGVGRRGEERSGAERRGEERRGERRGEEQLGRSS